MQETNVAVPLLRPDQNTPRSGGPTGRIRRLTNAIVDKHGDDGRIKVEKRTGFHALSRTTSSVISPGPAVTGIPGTTLLGTLGDELIQIGNSTPYVYAPTGPRYEKFDDVVITETAFRKVVQAGVKTMSQMSGANVGNVACWVWSSGGKCYATFIDLASDTPIRTPFEVASAGRIKVVADGTRFWLFYDTATVNVTVAAYDTTGLSIGSATATTMPALGAVPWDVQAMPGTGSGAVIAHNATIGAGYARITFITWAGAVTVGAPVFDQHCPLQYGVAFLRNDTDQTHLYVAATLAFNYTPPGPDPLRTPGVYVSKLTLAGVHVSTFILQNGMAQADARAIANLTGYTDAGNGGVFVSWTTYPQTGGTTVQAQWQSTVTTYRADPEPAPAVLYGVQRSVALAGGVMKIGTRDVIPCYYPSVSQDGALANQAVPVAQPTYFLIDVARQLKVGRLEYGTASFDWPFIGWDPAANYGDRFFMLPQPFTDTSGYVHWTAGFAADIETIQTADMVPVNKGIPEVGVADIRIGGRGVPIEIGDTTLLPGLRGMAFSRDAFRQAGVELGGEVPTVASGFDAADGIMVPGETHRYAIVWSTWDSRASRMRSIASAISAPVPVQPADNALLLTIPTLRMTSHPTVLCEIYRDVWDSSTRIASNQLRKITVDEQAAGDTRAPKYNDPTVDTIAFTDTVTNAAAAIGAPIYTDDGTLDFFACPNFSTGCVFGDRVFVGGYDNRVYYSFSRVPGQAIAFNQDEFFFTLPTNQRVTALAPLDNRLFIFCEKSIWYVDGGNFLSADGTAGSNPTPLELKFKNGCTGRAEAITAGVLYASSSGGLWLLTRGLENQYIGDKVEDDMEGATVLDIAVDKNQRVGVLTGSKLVVYDQIHNVWSVWPLPTPGVALTTWQGKFTYADDAGTQRTWQQTDAAYDDNGAPVQTKIEIDDMSTAEIFGFQVLWEMAFLGEWKGAHTFNVDCTYDGADTVDETFSDTFSADPAPFRFDTGTPRTIECSSVGLTIYDTFPGNVPSQGFTLESIGLYCGIERGKKYSERTISPAG